MKTNETIKAGMKVGATVGGLVFLAAGILPGFYFGSYGTLLMLQKVMGGTVDATLIARALVVMGSIVGIGCAAIVSLFLGGVLGAALGYVVTAPSVSRTAADHA